MVYIESTAFTRRLHRLAGDNALEVLRLIQDELLKNPSLGDPVRGLGGMRKRHDAPTRREGRGNAEASVICIFTSEGRGHIQLLYLLDKNEQADLSNEERNALHSLVEEIKRTKRGNS